MCFSAQGDLIGGLVVTAIGIDACLHVRRRPEYLAAAAFPIVLGLHQLDETFVWWSLQGHVSHATGRLAIWIYLVFAFVVLPIAVPAIVLSLQRTAARRWRVVPFVALGIAVSSILLEALMAHAPQAHLGSYHVAYSIGLQHGVVIVALYIAATCGSLFVSGIRNVTWFGLANLAVVIVLAKFSADGFTSLWCFYAALFSGALALFLRYSSALAPTDHGGPAEEASNAPTVQSDTR